MENKTFIGEAIVLVIGTKNGNMAAATADLAKIRDTVSECEGKIVCESKLEDGNAYVVQVMFTDDTKMKAFKAVYGIV